MKKVRICIINIHGLIRGEHLELGRDSDTGGQTLYVLELAKSLSKMDHIEGVDILTRQVIDRSVDRIYSQEIERINSKLKIIRIPCGPKRYLKKESLWVYLDTFIDRTLNYFKKQGSIPHIIHGHYADGGYVGAQLSNLLQIPFIFTAHSLGRVKLNRLLDKGRDLEKITSQYRINTRIEAEEIALDTASIVVTSTLQEVEEQYSIYEQYQPGTMEVIPPGVDLDKFHPKGGVYTSRVFNDIENFLRDSSKRIILAIARPDEKKNLKSLISVFGKSKELQELSNLVIIPGNREILDELEPPQRRVIISLLTELDNHNLYGKVALPKFHNVEDIPEIYRWAYERRGIFINPALTEPFGLTLLESGASGLPIVATNDGGPRDILATCKNGLLIDPLNEDEMEKAILRLLTDDYLWSEYSNNGLRFTKDNYSWSNHCSRYISHVDDLLKGYKPERFVIKKPKKAMPDLDRFIITDIDNTLTGDDEALREYIELINQSRDHIGFGVATGRDKDSALEYLDSLGIPRPQILITSVGTEIFYGEELIRDETWEKQVASNNWNRDRIIGILKGVDGLKLQEERNQDRFKISYIIDKKKIQKLGTIKRILRNENIKVKVIESMGCYLDIIPIGSGDGLAMRQLSYKWGIPWDRILVVGDSGNDESMLKGETLGVVVGNYSKELERLRNYPRVYFAKGKYARGILEGISYYNFLDEIRVPNNE